MMYMSMLYGRENYKADYNKVIEERSDEGETHLSYDINRDVWSHQ